MTDPKPLPSAEDETGGDERGRTDGQDREYQT